MCTVSMIADDWMRRRATDWPWYPQTAPNTSTGIDLDTLLGNNDPVKAKEFEDFKAEMRKELEAIKKLLVAAKTYDEATGQPDCEDANKVAVFKQLGKMLGVDMKEVFNT